MYDPVSLALTTANGMLVVASERSNAACLNIRWVSDTKGMDWPRKGRAAVANNRSVFRNILIA